MKKLFVFILCFVMLLSISAVSADENGTVLADFPPNVETTVDNDYDYGDNGYGEEIRIVADDIDMYYSTTYGYVVWLEDEEGWPVSYVDELKVIYSNGDEEIAEETDDGDYLFSLDKIRNQKATIVLSDSYYTADPIEINVKISKSPVKITTKTFYTNTKQYATLKAIIKDNDGEPIDEGTVRFNVNGKSYNVKVRDGVAVKKIKLTKAKTFTYSAIYVGNNHYKESKTSFSKVYVYSSSKKARTFNIKGYKITLNQKQYNKLINAKNTKKGVCFEIYTNKYVKQKYRDYYNNGKYVVKNVKARVSMVISYGGKDGLQTSLPNKYTIFLSTRYQYPDSFCKPWISGTKTSSEINKLNSAKVRRY